MKPDDITLLVSLCRTHAGLRVAPEKTYLIESRLNPVARRENYAGIPEMLAAVRTQRDQTLIWAIVEAMAAGESSFFRDKSVFDLLAGDVLPVLSEARGGAPVRVWSAACAAGQEIYSVAMMADELAAEGVKLELAASDLSERSLEKAQSGLYTQFEVQRGLPIRRLARHFTKDGDNWRLAPQIRQLVRWRRINLIAGLKGLGPFDVVLCRNVLAAMAPSAQTQVLADLAQVMPADGVLIVGAKEVLEPCAAFNPMPGAAGVLVRNPTYRAVAA